MIDTTLLYYGSLALLIFSIAFMAVIQKLPYRRILVPITFVATLLVMYVALVDLLSRPRPVQLVPQAYLPVVEEADLMADHMVEDEYIMLLLNWQGLDYPRWYRFPWNQQMAEDIQQAQNESRQQGGEGDVIMELPFDDSLERREFPYAHPAPQYRVLPDKPNQENRTIEVPHPSGEDA